MTFRTTNRLGRRKNVRASKIIYDLSWMFIHPLSSIAIAMVRGATLSSVRKAGPVPKLFPTVLELGLVALAH